MKTEDVKACCGEFSADGVRRYLKVQAAVFWGLILVAWLTYPAEHRFSIFTHTFSFLGSFNPEHHPGFWWVFSIAMLFWGVSGVPIALHFRRRFGVLSRWGATLGASCLLVGCLGASLVGFFPDVRAEWRPGLRYTEIHTQAALLIAGGYSSGLGIYVLLVLKALVVRSRGIPVVFPIARAVWPLGFWMAASGTCLFQVLWWEHLYAIRKAAAMAAGRPIGSSWAEGLNTWHAFPLWENLSIYTLYVSLAWLAVALSPPASGRSGEPLTAATPTDVRPPRSAG